MRGKRWDFPNGLTLIGGFKCDLTNAEANEFDGFIKQRPEFKRIREIEVQINVLAACCAGKPIDGDECRQYAQANREYQATLDSLYLVASAWFEELKARDAASNDAKKAEESVTP